MDWFTRWKYRFIVFMRGDLVWNAAFDVGSKLSDISTGRAPIPSKEDFKKLSDRLLILERGKQCQTKK